MDLKKLLTFWVGLSTGSGKTIYRIGSPKFPAGDGQGAALYGGRWNEKGTPVIYCGASRALCALELLANAGRLASEYAIWTIDVPPRVRTLRMKLEELPLGWDSPEPGVFTRAFGTHWAKSLSGPAILEVPSAVLPFETNYVPNPRHPAFRHITFSDPVPFRCDPRLTTQRPASS